MDFIMDHDYIKRPAKKSRNTKYCCVPQCGTYGALGISFHLFPKDKILANKWKVALRIGKPISSGMRVCSRHFKASNYFPNNSKRQKLFPNVVPSQNIPKRIFNKKGPVVRKIKSIAQGTQSLSVTKQGNIVTSNRKVKKVMDGLSCDDITDTNSHHDLKTSSTQVNLVDYRHYRPQADWSMADLLCERVPLEKCTQINFLPLWKEEIAAPTQLTFSDLLNSVKDLFYLTDIHSIELLEALVNYVRESAVNTSTDEKFLSLRETLIVTMNKLKQNISI